MSSGTVARKHALLSEAWVLSVVCSDKRAPIVRERSLKAVVHAGRRFLGGAPRPVANSSISTMKAPRDVERLGELADAAHHSSI
jgi:hypothetical protein